MSKSISLTTISKQISIQTHRQTWKPPQNIMPPKPHHTKKAIPFSLFLWICPICSMDTFFDQWSQELIEYLTKSSYSHSSLQRNANHVHLMPHHANLEAKEQKSAETDQTPFCTSFNPKISSFVNKYTTLFQSTTNCKRAFPNPPVIASRCNASHHLLVHATLSHENSSSQESAGIKKCKQPQCLTCSLLWEGQTNYTFLRLTELEKSPNPYLATQKILDLIECKKMPPSIQWRDQALTQWMLWGTLMFYPESSTTQHNYTSITTLSPSWPFYYQRLPHRDWTHT